VTSCTSGREVEQAFGGGLDFRLGRRGNRPGLILLRLSSEPHDRQILDDPIAAFKLDDARPLQIPIHLDLLRYKHALAVYTEWMDRLKKRLIRWDDFNAAITGHFGFDPAPHYAELKGAFEDRFGTLVDPAERLQSLTRGR